MAEDDRERQAEALSKMTGGEEPAEPAPPPSSAKLFRQARPAEPGSNLPEPNEKRRARPAAPPSRDDPTIAPEDVAARRLGAVSTHESDTLPIYVPPSDPASTTSAATPQELTARRPLERKRTF